MTTAIVRTLSSESASMILGDDLPDVQRLAASLESFVARANAAQVVSDEDSRAATDMLVAAKSAWKALEEDRERRKAPILREGRAIDALYRPAKDTFAEIERVIKAKVSSFLRHKQEEAARQLAEAVRAREDAEASRRAAMADGDKAAVAQASMALIEADRAMPLENVVSGIRAETGSVGIRYKKVANVIDITQVPRDYLERAVMSDTSALLRLAIEAYKAGQMIPGVEVVEEQVIAVRSGL